LANAARHAGAKRADISVSTVPDGVMMVTEGDRKALVLEKMVLQSIIDHQTHHRVHAKPVM
jgi:hypothetical protein